MQGWNDLVLQCWMHVWFESHLISTFVYRVSCHIACTVIWAYISLQISFIHVMCSQYCSPTVKMKWIVSPWTCNATFQAVYVSLIMFLLGRVCYAYGSIVRRCFPFTNHSTVQLIYNNVQVLNHSALYKSETMHIIIHSCNMQEEYTLPSLATYKVEWIFQYYNVVAHAWWVPQSIIAAFY